MTETNSRSFQAPAERRRTLRDLRFAILVASALICAVLAVGALAAPLLGWSQWPDARTPEHVQVVRLGEPPARALRIGVATPSSERSHRPKRRVVRHAPPPPVRRIGDAAPQVASSSTVARAPARRAEYTTTTRSGPMLPSRTPRPPRWRAPASPPAGSAPQAPVATAEPTAPVSPPETAHRPPVEEAPLEQRAVEPAPEEPSPMPTTEATPPPSEADPPHAPGPRLP